MCFRGCFVFWGIFSCSSCCFYLNNCIWTLLTCLSFKGLSMDSFQTDGTWQMFPLTYDFTSSHLLSFSSTCLRILMTYLTGFLWPSWTDGASVLQSRIIYSGRQNKEKGRRKAMVGEDFENSDKGHMLGLLRDSLIILHFQQKQWWEWNISYLTKWQFARLTPVLCKPDILSCTLFALISFFFSVFSRPIILALFPLSFVCSQRSVAVIY